MREELEAFDGLMPLLAAEWRRPWLPAVLSCDASLTGWGIARSWWGALSAGDCRRTAERSRFVRSGGVPARRRALEGAGFRQEQGKRPMDSRRTRRYGGRHSF